MKKLLSILAIALLIPQIAFGFGLQGYVGDSENFPHGVTFVGIYDDNLTADYSVGSATSIFAASRGANNPGTYYVGSPGVLQVETSSNVGRHTSGWYDATGWHDLSWTGVWAETASTNYITDSMFGRAIGVDDWTSAMGVITDSDAEIINIAGAKERNIAYTFSGAEGSWLAALRGTTANDSFDVSGGNIDVTVSFWMKGDVSGITTGRDVTRFFQVEGIENDNSETEDLVILTLNQSADLSPTEFRRFSYSGTLSHSLTRKLAITFLQIRSTNKPTNGENFDITITGVQTEKQPFPTSFIPTTTAALTRNIEENKYENAGNATAAVETIVIKLAPEFASGIAQDFVILDTDNKQRFIKFNSGSDDVHFSPNLTDTIGCIVDNLINESYNAHQEMTLGFNMQSTGNPNAAGFFNGVADGTDDNDDFTANDWGTSFYVGSDKDGANQVNAVILGIARFNRLLSAAEHLFLKEKDWRTLR